MYCLSYILRITIFKELQNLISYKNSVEYNKEN